MAKRKSAEQRIRELEERVLQLEARPATKQESHFHYHYERAAYPAPYVQPWQPIWYSTTTGASPTITTTANGSSSTYYVNGEALNG